MDERECEFPDALRHGAHFTSVAGEMGTVTEPEEETKPGGMKTALKRAKLNSENLKSRRFTRQAQKDLFTLRLRCPGGQVTPDKLKVAANIADKYGRGEVRVSVRQSIEVPNVSHEYFDVVTEILKAVDWSVAPVGPCVHGPTACAGCSYNPRGLMDTQSVCLEVDRRYVGTPTGHHKFKISFSGCPSDCFRTREMDLGFQGIVEPELLESVCTGCGLCVKSCEECALRMENGVPVRDVGKCNGCGDCVKVCPADAMAVARRGWLVRAGGKYGKHPVFAHDVANYISNDDVYALIEKTLEWYRANGEGRERIAAAIGRLGVDKYVEEVVKPLRLEAIETPEAEGASTRNQRIAGDLSRGMR